jgi:hypothetical protein
MRNHWLGRKRPFEWRLGAGLLIALAVTWAGISGVLLQLDQKLAEAAIRERIQEARVEAERRREQAANEPPQPEHRQEPSSLPTSPAVADEPIDFEDAFRLRTDPEYRKRALKWAEEEEARRARDRRPQEETPEQREAAAARRLKIARQLEVHGFPAKASVHYRVIADHYPDTQAAKEAAQALELKKP